MDGLAGIGLQQQLARSLSGAGAQEPCVPGSGRDRELMQLFTAMVGIVDAQLGSTGAYIACERFTAADIAIGLAIHRWFSTPIPRPSFVNVDRYYERLLERSGFRRYGRDGGP